MFGSAELSGVDSGSGVVVLFSGSGPMVDALNVIKKGCAIVCLQFTLFRSKRLLSVQGQTESQFVRIRWQPSWPRSQQ